MQQVVAAFHAETAMVQASDVRLRECKVRLQRATRNHRKAQADLDSLRRSIFIDAATLQSAMAPPPAMDGSLSPAGLHRRTISRSVPSPRTTLRRRVWQRYDVHRVSTTDLCAVAIPGPTRCSRPPGSRRARIHCRPIRPPRRRPSTRSTAPDRPLYISCQCNAVHA